jgi:hypothetical protein
LSCWNLLRSEAVAIEILHDWLGDAAHFWAAQSDAHKSC